MTSRLNRRAVLSAAGTLVVLVPPAVAAADPCKAVPDKGAVPSHLSPGKRFSGTVRYIVDGDGLCVGRSSDPAGWVEVRLADFRAPELREPSGEGAKQSLRMLVFGRQVDCVAGRRSYDRIVARCTLNGPAPGTPAASRRGPRRRAVRSH
jgi:endonuclease YncB( thermonuclease family)